MTDNASYGGWVRIYRNFLDWEWYGDTSCVRLAVHFMLRANYQPRKWRGIVIERGQLITSRNGLSDETGLSPMQVRTAIDKLLDCGFITKTATNSYTTITICNYNRYQSGSESNNHVGNQETACAYPADSQPSATTKEEKKKKEKEVTAHTQVISEKGVEGGKHGSPSNISIGTEPAAGQPLAETGNEAPQIPAGNVSEDKQRVGATELLVWVGGRFADIASMDEPLTEQQALWMLRKYDTEDIHRLIAAMHNKGAAKYNCNAFNTFLSYAQLDRIILRKQKRQTETGRLYTYDQFCDMTAPQGGYTAADFEILHVGGQTLRRLKPELSAEP